MTRTKLMASVRRLDAEVSTWSWADLLIVGLACLHVGLFLFVALSRRSYPLDLEWMEGGQLLDARELMHGRLPYRAPSTEHIAFPYQPLYPALVALIAKVTGLSMGTGRLVSILSTLVLGSLIGYTTYLQTHRSVRWAIVATGLVFSMYRATGFWFDLVRVDSLFVALIVGLLVAADRHRGLAGAIVLAVLAYKTKQLAILFLWIPAVVLFRRSARQSVIYVAAVASVLAADHVIENFATGGWYSFFTFKVPNGQTYIAERIRKLIWDELFTTAPLLLFVGGWACLRRLKHQKVLSAINPWILAAVVGVGAAVVAWCRPGGYANNFIPTYVLLIPPCVVKLRRWEVSLRKYRLAALPVALVVAHMIQQVPDVRSQIPNADERFAAAELVRILRNLDGPLLVPEHPWYAVLAGKAASYHACELWEVSMTDPSVRDSVRARIEAKHYEHVVVSSNDGWHPPDLAKHYVRVKKTLPSLRTFTGTGGIDLSQVYVRRPASSEGPAE